MTRRRNHFLALTRRGNLLARYGKAIAPYRAVKGTLKLPLDEPVPADLVGKLAKVRVRERRLAGQG